MKIIIFLLLSINLYSQEIKFNIFFSKDSIKIGEPIFLTSVLSYDKKLEIVQPDSSYNFNPFEYIDKFIYPSKIYNGKIFDSTIYYLRTFNIDSVQKINLNSFIINKDCLEISSSYDSVFLINQVKNLSDKVIKNTSHSIISYIFNTNKYILSSVIFLIVILILFLIFRKKIITYLKIQRLNKDLNNYSNLLKDSLNKYSNGKDKKDLELSLLIWKRYMEKNSIFSFTSSTTLKINNYLKDKKTENILDEIDMILYSKNTLIFDIKNFNLLDRKAKDLYINMKKKLKDGK